MLRKLWFSWVQKLPTQLIAAFQATLEEIESSTLLMHIVDVSHPNASAQSASVLSVRSFNVVLTCC